MILIGDRAQSLRRAVRNDAAKRKGDLAGALTFVGRGPPEGTGTALSGTLLQ